MKSTCCCLTGSLCGHSEELCHHMKLNPYLNHYEFGSVFSRTSYSTLKRAPLLPRKSIEQVWTLHSKLTCCKLEYALYLPTKGLYKVVQKTNRIEKSRRVTVMQTPPSPGWGLEGITDTAGAGHLWQHLLQRAWSPMLAEVDWGESRNQANHTDLWPPVTLRRASQLESGNKECFWGTFHPGPSRSNDIRPRGMWLTRSSLLSARGDSHASLWSPYQTYGLHLLI